MKTKKFYSKDLESFKAEKVINIFGEFADYNRILNNQIEACIYFYMNFEFQKAEKYHEKLVLMLKNEKEVKHLETQKNLLELVKFYLKEDLNIKAHEIMCYINDDSVKFKAYMAYANKITVEFGEAFGNVYVEKAKKILNSSEGIKKDFVLKHNIPYSYIKMA